MQLAFWHFGSALDAPHNHRRPSWWARDGHIEAEADWFRPPGRSQIQIEVRGYLKAGVTIAFD